MKVPNFKPTKWQLHYCNHCKYTDSSTRSYCSREGHNVSTSLNVPFFVPDMEFTWVGQKWSGLKSVMMNKSYSLSASRLEKIIKGCGIEPGGKLPNKWWMFSKVGSSLSIIMLDE